MERDGRKHSGRFSSHQYWLDVSFSKHLISYLDYWPPIEKLVEDSKWLKKESIRCSSFKYMFVTALLCPPPSFYI